MIIGGCCREYLLPVNHFLVRTPPQVYLSVPSHFVSEKQKVFEIQAKCRVVKQVLVVERVVRFVCRVQMKCRKVRGGALYNDP